MRIGIYGGTFNPIHYGHVNIIKGFYKGLNLDKVIVIPTATPPHKKSTDLASAKDRVNMCKIALSELDYCELSEIEINREGKSFTVDTLIELEKMYPNDEFFLLMGEDMFMIINKWREFQKIFSIATICCTPRSVDGIENIEKFANSLKIEYNNFRFQIINIPYIKVSSTEIRNGDHHLIPKDVCKYIDDNKLYI